MPFERSLVASLFFFLAAGCSSSSGDSGGSSGSSGGSSGGANASDASNVDGTTGASSSGAGTSSGSSGGSSGASSSSGGASEGGPHDAASDGSSSGVDAGCIAAYDGGPLSDGGPGAAAGGASAVAAYCQAGCNRAQTCGLGQNDAGGCASDCLTGANSLASLERADYLASLTSCIGNADCATLAADGGFSSAVSACATAAFVAIPQDMAITSLCQTVSCLSCASAQSKNFDNCLATYGNIGDGTLLALKACLSSNFCSDPDAGIACERTALTPH